MPGMAVDGSGLVADGVKGASAAALDRCPPWRTTTYVPTIAIMATSTVTAVTIPHGNDLAVSGAGVEVRRGRLAVLPLAMTRPWVGARHPDGACRSAPILGRRPESGVKGSGLGRS